MKLFHRFRRSNARLRSVVLGAMLVLLSGGGWALSSFSRADRLVETVNYTGEEGPLYTGRYAPLDRSTDLEIVVVSYNLKYARATDEAARAFEQLGPLNEADILLLQEMDEVATGELARRLGYDYVYFPASIASDGDNFGNAILSRWPLSDPQKLILPGLHPLTGQQRTATRANVRIGDEDVVVYSTHLEVASAPPAMRGEQVEAIVADIPTGARRVIVGGDFNTVTRRGVTGLASQFESAGLTHDSADLGPTFTRFGLRPSATDHIFSRGFQRLDAGVMPEVTASDHFPVWVRFAVDR